ncbi:chromate transporter [Eubacterium oxidoreducens]|uniref:Chromate transporter n=1 Tax=Eubacterium oxidoreducens TaxID=1732 RepID=A0A1G6CGY6_EUBOX|nr:chromate transporter [Eubacterium oxidoreducens]SDB32075.1 chromate transporter [Eubacterium oxidoreducens]
MKRRNENQNANKTASCENKRKFKDFCIEIFKVGFVGFGGGNALVPVMEEAFVRNDEFDEDQKTYDKDVLVANLTPGALPVELASALGNHAFGPKGMLLGPVLFSLPGVIMAAVLFMVLSSLSEGALNYINIAAVGVAGFIIALLCDYIAKVFARNKIVSERRFKRTYLVVGLVIFFTCGSAIYKLLGVDVTSVFSISTVHMLAVAFFIAFWLHGNRDALHITTTLVLSFLFMLANGKAGFLSQIPFLLPVVEILMLVLSVVGLISSVRETKVRLELDRVGIRKTFWSWLIFIVVLSIPAVVILQDAVPFLLRDLLSTFMSFGGGDAYLTIADGMFVEQGYISEDIFYSQIITVVNVLPGSILCKTLFGIGFYMGYGTTGVAALGILTGISAFACSVGASCAAFYLIYYLYSGISKMKAIEFIGRWIRPIVCGLLVKVMLALINSGMALDETTGVSRWVILIFIVVLAGVNYYVKKRFKPNPWLMVIVDIIVSLVFFAIL